MFEGGDVGLVFDDIVLIGNEYPPASQGVRLRGCVLETSPCFCCSTALEPAFNSDVTSILTSLSSTTVPPMFVVSLNILSSVTFSNELSTDIVFESVEVSRLRTLESGRPIQDINLSRLLNPHALHTRYVEDM